MHQLEKKFWLKSPKKVLTIRKSRLAGFYRDYEVKINPFAGGGNSWVLLKCPNPRNFLAGIRPKKPFKISHQPIKAPRESKELLTQNPDFNSKFKIVATPSFPVNEVLFPSIQEKLLQLLTKIKFEIQIIQEGIFFSSEKEILDISLVNSIFDLLVDIAQNLG